MSRKNRKRSHPKTKNSFFSNSASGKIFSKENFFKIFLPSLFLLFILLMPIIFHSFRTRHQEVGNVIEAPVPPDWFDDLFNGNPPSGDIDPTDPDYSGTTPYPTDPSQPPDPSGFMDGFTNGIIDPERILFRISPTDHKLYWRLQAYDTYETDSWSRNVSTHPINGYSSLPALDDGEFSVTANLSYSGGVFNGFYPAPYHYNAGEVFSENYQFSPVAEWDASTTTLEEDIYGCKSFNAYFNNQSGNSTLTYDCSYRLQDNDYLREESDSFDSLESILLAQPSISNRYLQLPANYSTLAPTAYSLASELYDSNRSVYLQVMRDIMWLNENAQYDYEMLMGNSDASPADGEDYVEWFLSRREGTAAHFAATLSILCRLQNIPSRIVVGFSYGEENGDEFIIRAKHVHSWVECYIPLTPTTGYWVQFDPSPLLPSIRDEYGENINGYEFVFQCSNEFFLSPLHMHRLTSPPYFVPNSMSSAWSQNPYNTSDWYGPYVNRTEPFDLYAYLGSGTNLEFYNYLINNELDQLTPIVGEQVDFIDATTNEFIGTAFTDEDGFAIVSYSFPLSTPSGLHYIMAEWEGIQVPTYDLRFISEELVETGVYVTSTTNISSYNSLGSSISSLNESICFSFSLAFELDINQERIAFVKIE
jgi:transglutaminase-like putative cysteine protease